MLLSSGPQLIKDIAPGTASSVPTNGFVYQHQLYFVANDGVHGNEMWKSDGTASGTTMLRDVNPVGGSGSGWRTELNGVVYFSIDDGTHGTELWKTDGTESGTVLVKDLNPIAGGSSPADLTTLDGFIYFTADDGTGRAIWKSDGTDAGTAKLFGGAQIVSWVNSLVPANGRLFFYTNDIANGWELWSSDGTTAGTKMVRNIGPSDSIIQPASTRPVAFNGFVYFAATDGTHGAELWKSDGTASGTVMIRDIVPGSTWGLLNDDPKLTVVGQTLYFRARDALTGTELWKTNGTEESTALVSDISPGATGSSPDYFTAADNLLYFVANDGTHGVELWRSDGTSAGTSLTLDILSGSGSSMLSFKRAAFDDKLYFSANDGVSGEELWETDGSPGGTILVADIFPGRPSSITSPGPGVFTVVDNALFLSARDPANGEELWIHSLVDSTPPQLQSAQFNIDSRSIELHFDEAISQPVAIPSLGVTNLLNGIPIAEAVVSASYPDSFAVRLALAETVSEDANYELHIASSSITDLAGNPIAALTFSASIQPEFDFFLLAGDAARDRHVDIQDFNVLAAEFGASGKLFSEGNLDRIGTVDSIDLNILIANFGKRLAPPAQSALSIVTPSLFSVGQQDCIREDDLLT